MPSVMAMVEWPTFLVDSRMDALLERQCRPRVAQAVQREAGQAVLVDSPQELGAHGIGPEAGSVGLMEHEALVGEVGADEHALFEHHLAVIAEDGDGRVVEGDRPAAA